MGMQAEDGGQGPGNLAIALLTIWYNCRDSMLYYTLKGNGHVMVVGFVSLNLRALLI